MRQALAGFAVVVLTAFAGAQAPPRDRQAAPRPAAKAPGVVLGDLSWKEAATELNESAVVVIPLGVATVEQGPHLRLNHNERLARYLASRVQAATAVVIAPPLAYHFYPTFLEYPGSTSLSRVTARDMTADIVKSLSRYGPRRFYVLNTGITTMAPLSDAAAALRSEGILLGYTDPTLYLRGAGVELQQAVTRGVGHGDEVETSMMLFVDPSAVDMSKAVREYGPGSGPMTRQKDAPGLYSESGVFGDPTLATREKGQAIVDSLVSGALADIDKMRTAELPERQTVAPPPPPSPPAARANRSQEAQERAINGCTALEDRTIRQIGPRFSSYWKQMDAVSLGLLFANDGDMRHPDGTIERGQTMIRQNREELFAKKEYRGSSHPLTLGDVRCITPNVAIADGKWELRLVSPAEAANPGRGLTPDRYNTGWCTLVLVGGGDNWHITAWRYTVNPSNGAPPTTLKQPGFIRGGGGG
jgi:creatinine amidohydrolase